MTVSGTFAAGVATAGMWSRPISSALRGNAFTDRGTPPKKEFGYDLRNGANPMDIIPPHAVENECTDVEGGSDFGRKWTWKNEAGQTERLRIHSSDPNAGEGVNSGDGDTYRVQIGGRYQDEDGNLYHRQSHNPNSPHHHPAATNSTHISMPSHVDWRGTRPGQV